MKQLWPAWRFGPNGEKAVFETAEDVPEGWMTRDEWDALERPCEAPEKAAEPERSDAIGDKPAARLKAALMGLKPDILDHIEAEPTLPDAAAAAITSLAEKLDLYVEAFHPSEKPAGDLNNDGKVEDNRDEIKKALKALEVEFDGRAATPALKALLDEAQAKKPAGA